MSIEGGGLGGIGGGVGGGIAAGAGGGIGAGVSIGPALGGVGLGMSSGIETGGLTGAAPALADPGILGEFRGFGGSGPVNEGPVGLSDLQTTAPWQAEVTNPLGQANIDVLSQAGDVANQAWGSFTEQDAIPDGQPKIDVFSQVEEVAAEAWDFNVVTQAEEVLSEAQKPAIFSPVTLNHSVILNEVKDLSRMRVPNELGDSSLVTQNDNKAELAVLPQVEPMIAPLVAPNIMSNILDFPKPEVIVSPALKPAVQTEPQTGSEIANEAAPAIMVQPALEEQALIEETVTERDTAKQIDTVREEIEEFKLKVVVDEEVLENRVVGLTGAAEVAAAKNEGGEIEGNKIVALTPPESEKERSGLIKKQGPDGSWIETLEELASRKFKSIKEAKKQIVEIIARKVPVKRGKEGKEAGSEAVARVLKYLFVKATPVEQIITRVIKKQKVSVQEGQKPSQVEIPKPQAKGSRIEDFPPLAEVYLPARQAFLKAA